MGEHRCAGFSPTNYGGQESLIPYELLLSILFPRQRLLFCLCFVPHSHTSFNSPFCPALPLPKSCSACPLQVPPPVYFLPFTLSSLLPYIVDLALIFLYCVCNAFFFTFCFTGIFPKYYLELTIFLFLKFISSAVTNCIFLQYRIFLPPFSWNFLGEFVVIDYFFVCSLNLLHQLWLFAFLL